MSIFLYTISLACSALASPPQISSDRQSQLLPPTNTPSSISTEFGKRSTWDILWGCLVTIFACSWVSVHPHIPPPDAKWWRIAWIRFELMVWTILAPEIIILLAAKQWMAARQLKETYRERGWTITHGFFIQMGGFMLFDGKIRKGVISPRRFQALIEMRQITFPEITEEEIQDRSKGDGLSKGLVLMQVAWFIVQFSARIAEGLNITQLELATFAFATLNGFMYLFWWNKPLDIRIPIPVHLLHPTAPIQESIASYSDPAISHSPRASIFEAKASATRISNINDYSQRWELWRHNIEKTWNRRFDVVNNYPNFQLLDKMSVPIFFSSLEGPESTVRYGYVISSVLGALFGAVHCAGWDLIFPSVAEQYMWRIGSAFIVTYPMLFLSSLLLDSIFPNFWENFTKYYLSQRLVEVLVLGVFFPIYIMARLFILLESFLALRTLPDSAIFSVQWTTFLPHV